MDTKAKQTRPHGNKTIVAFFIFVLALTMTMLQVACSPQKNDAASAATGNQNGNGNAITVTPAKPVLFFKVALLPDRSGSVDSTRTPFITMDQLEVLIDFLGKNSGEIAFGFIDDDSNQPFLRLRIEARPVSPIPPAQANNPYEQEKLLNKYRVAVSDYRQHDQKWQAETVRRIETFKTEAQTKINCLHDTRCRAGSTDILEGLKRADLFLSENEDVTNQINILVLITDGLETLKPHSAPPPLKSQPRIIVVNGSASLGILKNYQVEAVEGIDAAIRQITRYPDSGFTPASIKVAKKQTQK